MSTSNVNHLTLNEQPGLSEKGIADAPATLQHPVEKNKKTTREWAELAWHSVAPGRQASWEGAPPGDTLTGGGK